MRYKNTFHYDLMQLFAGWDRNRWKSLDFYLNLFGVGSKGGMSGADVYPAYKSGEFDKIKTYCESDVLRTCELFSRVWHWFYVKIEDHER